MLYFKRDIVLEQKSIRGQTAAAIAASVEAAIFGGKAEAGDALPTVRSLARGLKVSPATVAAAYRTLRSRGLISGNRRGGTRVSYREQAGRRFTDRAAVDLIADLALDDPDPALLPPLDTALHALDVTPAMYDDSPDLPGLVAFASGEFSADAIDVPALAVVGGTLDAVVRGLREYTRPGDAVAVEDPCSPDVVDVVRSLALSPLPVAVDEEGPQPDAVDAALRRAHCRAIVISPRAQNPTGAAVTPSRAADLRRILRRFPDPLLIEIDEASAVAGVGAVTVVHDARAHWVIVRSASKFLGPDLRVAVVAGDDLTIARVRSRQAVDVRRVSRILQQLALSMWSDPSSARRLARAAEIYAQRREDLLAGLRRRGIAALGRSGFYVWIPVREEDRVTHGLRDRGWRVAAGERFRIASPAAIRVTTATLSRIDAERFAAALSELKGCIN
jgi:DNA-binding transcriptional MocR family regulator